MPRGRVYMRQDAVFAPREPVSQRVVGDCLARAFDRVLTIVAHLHRTRRPRTWSVAAAR